MGFGSIFNRKKKQQQQQQQQDQIPISGSPKSANNPNLLLIRTPSRNLTDTQIKELEEVFKKFDANGDGRISSSELRSVMGSLGQETTDEDLRKLMEEVDADGDGYIDFKEFVELNTKGVDADEVLANLKEAFAVYDIDGNGSISTEELHEVLKSLGDDCSIAECRKMISGVDSDGDGYVDFEEFKVMMMVGARSDHPPLDSSSKLSLMNQ